MLLLFFLGGVFTALLIILTDGTGGRKDKIVTIGSLIVCIMVTFLVALGVYITG